MNNLANELCDPINVKSTEFWCHLTLILSLKSNIEGNQLQYILGINYHK